MTTPSSNLIPKPKLDAWIFGSLIPIWCIFWHFIPCFPRTQSAIYFKSTNAWIFGSLVPILVHFSRPQVSFFLVWISFFFLLVRDISFPKVLVRVLLGISQIQKVLVFQLNGFREFLRNYSVEVTRLKKSTRYQFTGFVRVFHQLHGLHFFPFFCGPISISKNHMLLCFSF